MEGLRKQEGEIVGGRDEEDQTSVTANWGGQHMVARSVAEWGMKW